MLMQDANGRMGWLSLELKYFKQTLKRYVVATVNGNKSLLSYGEMHMLMAERMIKMNNWLAMRWMGERGG